MITAQEFINKNIPATCIVLPEWLIEFAKLHVTEALKKANENTKTGVRDACGDIRADLVEKYILNAYSLDNVE